MPRPPAASACRPSVHAQSPSNTAGVLAAGTSQDHRHVGSWHAVKLRRAHRYHSGRSHTHGPWLAAWLCRHEKTPKQEANWVEFGVYRSMVDGLREEVAGVLKEKEWSVQTRRKYQEYLLPLIFTVLPLRNEFVMTVVSKSAFNRLTPAEKEKGNYFVAPQKGPMFLVINQYKTSKRYGEKIIELEDPELVASLKVWLKHRPADTTSLFFEPVGMVEPATSGSITKVMTAVSKRELGGKSIGSSLLRHIFLSAKYADTLKEMEADAEVMGHSVETAQKIYVKN